MFTPSQDKPTTPCDAPQAAAEREGTAHCSRCEAVCCRLTVVVTPEDHVPSHLTEALGNLTVLAHGADGWCVALDRARMCCSIYDTRPAQCRRFAMDGPYCRSVRAEYFAQRTPGIERIPQREETP